MTGHLFKFETFQSRMIRSSSPLGTSGRLTTIRLRRYFQPGRLSRATELPPDYANLGRDPMESATHLEQYSRTNDCIRSETLAVTDRLARDFADDLHIEQTGWRDFRKTRKIWGAWPVDSSSKLPATAHGDALPLDFPEKATAVEHNTALLYKAMRMQDPHAVLYALIKLVGLNSGSILDGEALRSIPSTTFSEILFFLEPENFVGRYSRLHSEISRQTSYLLGLPPTTSYRFHTVFLYHLRGIFTARNKSHSQSISDYKYMLKCARATGDIAMAEIAWKFMRIKKITPDSDCFKYYLATKCLSDHLKPNQRYNLRVTPYHLRLRSWSAPPHGFSGHRVGSAGLKLEATHIFRSMTKAGVAGDEATFCLLMTALAREGDLAGVGTILKSVWNIDVESIMTSSGTSYKGFRGYAIDSPFHPSGRLLFTISHIYGINNAIPIALRLVDLISQKYAIVIPHKVWWELLQRTYVLSVKRTARQRSNPEWGTQTGQLPLAAVDNLWTTMTSEPYKVRPSMAMYDLAIRSLIFDQQYTKAKVLMDSGRKMHNQGVRDFKKIRQQLANDIRSENLAETSSSVRNLQFIKLRMQRNRLYVRGWVRMLLRSMQFHLRHNKNFVHRDLPDILRHWELFSPYRLQYRPLGPRASFKTDAQRHNRVRQQQYAVQDMLDPQLRDVVSLLQGNMRKRQQRPSKDRWGAQQARRLKRREFQKLAQEMRATEQTSLIG